jgi:hypothetical protein
MAGGVFGARGEMVVDTAILINCVMAGLVPAIHVFEPLCCKDVDARHKLALGPANRPDPGGRA